MIGTLHLFLADEETKVQKVESFTREGHTAVQW